MPHSAAAGAPYSPSTFRDSVSRRKPPDQIKSFRKFSSLFRLNGTATIPAAVALGTASPPATNSEIPVPQVMDTEETDASNFFQRGELYINAEERQCGERSRTYSAALPSAAYLGISIDSSVCVGGSGDGAGVSVSGPQPSDSNTNTTTTSTGVSVDAYSLTTSSNFFSAADSSAESLRVSKEINDIAI